MRWMFVLLLLLPVSYALVVESSGSVGQNPVIYGDVIAYAREGSIYVYDAVSKQENFVAIGSDPFEFGFIVVFETPEKGVDLNGDGDFDDEVIQFADVRDRKVVNTHVAGRHPSLFSDLIVFASPWEEVPNGNVSDAGVYDKGSVIVQFDRRKNETKVFGASGDFPVMTANAIVFLQDENKAGSDLDADQDRLDQVVSVLDRTSGKVSNTHFASMSKLSLSRGLVVFSDGLVKAMDVKSETLKDTKLEGSDPALFGDVVIYENDGELFGYALNSGARAKLQVKGVHPSIFEKKIAFVTSEQVLGDLNGDGKANAVVMRFARDNDADRDNISDFIDNCPDVQGLQPDHDRDGVGDACDKDSPPIDEEVHEAPREGNVLVETNETGSQESGAIEKGSHVAWYWYVLGAFILIAVAPFAFKVGVRYYRRRRKSFGF